MIKMSLCLTAAAALTITAFSSTTFAASPFYGKELCHYDNFKCVTIKRGETWDNLFPDLRDREIVKRLNRTNMPLFMHSWIVVPNNLKQIEYTDIAPFNLQYNTKGQRVILVNLTLQAFGAYDTNGKLVHWGPVSGGQNYCKELYGPCKTITGEFHIMRKGSEDCTSSQFPVDTKGGAPMPYCMHFYNGFALHASTLPGYHASHGCVRLFYDDAKWLNESFAKVGTKVIITN